MNTYSQASAITASNEHQSHPLRLWKTMTLAITSLVLIAALVAPVAATPIPLVQSGLFALKDTSNVKQADIAYVGSARGRADGIELAFGSMFVTPIDPWAFASLTIVIPSDQATPLDGNGVPITQTAHVSFFSDTSFSSLITTISKELVLEPRNSRTPTLFSLSTASPNIRGIRINRTGSTAIQIGDWVIDKTAAASSIPEPATGVLFLIALASVASFRRMKQSRVAH